MKEFQESVEATLVTNKTTREASRMSSNWAGRTPFPSVARPRDAALSQQARWAQEIAEACAERVRQVVMRLLEQGLPVTPEGLFDFETGLHHVVARECLDPVTAEVIQAVHENAEVQDQALSLFLQAGVNAQRSAQDVAVTLLGGSRRTIKTQYCLRRRPRRPKRRQEERKKRAARDRKLSRRAARRRAQGATPDVTMASAATTRGKGGNGLYPVLAVLGIHFRVTPALGSEVARQVALGTLDEARATLLERGVDLDKKVIRRVAAQIAERALGYRQWCVEQGARMKTRKGQALGKRLAIVIDGGRLRVRLNRRAGRPRKSGYPGFDADWREPKLFVIYELDERGRKKKRGLLYQDGTLGDADRLFELLAAALRQLGAEKAESWVILGDGADWIWCRTARLWEQLGYDASKVTEVVDFYHASQRVQEMAAQMATSEAEVQSHQREARRLLRLGSIERLLEWLGPCEYLETHCQRMRYVSFRRRRLPIGSGAVESCIRRVVNLRMKGNSIYWGEGMAEAVLHLRCQLLAGRWHQFIRETLDHGRHPLVLAALDQAA
jgi:hypothetical protein